uniref:Uncharacterized protein n=1 Tax=Kalanchoe fedtschenkoi TaxID=63787 RepID=A0A7N0T794_KALFE
MADLLSYGDSEREIEQVLITLKKGAQLLKYSRKGKPKFRSFRVSTDETTLIWISHGEERSLKLSSVQRIIPGQRTAVFRRYLRPEKDYLSFSLLYNNGERSLDLICKDKVEAEVWFAGLKALISTNRNRRSGSVCSDFQDGELFRYGRPSGSNLDFTPSIARGRLSIDLTSQEGSVHNRSSDAASKRVNMQPRISNADGFRISVSSTPSCSSQGSGPDEHGWIADVYVWGQILTEGALPDGSVSVVPKRTDVLIPRALEPTAVNGNFQIACGVRHIACVSRGEVYTWGEEKGGTLGHGTYKDFSRPRLIDYLRDVNVDFIACGEYHTCAISTSGDLYTWGDSALSVGLLGSCTGVSHWIPTRVSGPLVGLHVLSIACGTWHSAMITSNGKLFTFGDGTFGVLGHGDRESFSNPKEVQLLSGLKTIKVACGVWHTAAIVEVANQTAASISSRKLFTWGDGEKYRLGHGSKENYLLPTCVSSLIDYNFHQLACGHTMTIALTTSGHVFTMGGSAHGQLGNPQADGKLPCLVQDKLVGEFVEEISCGAEHVAVLTSRSEVFTWGKGANGRLGHGDTEDRKTPTLVEALKDRRVKSISCGSNFSAIICIRKWVDDESVCRGCNQTFSMFRKRIVCNQCGYGYCFNCVSRKIVVGGKLNRVCDSCYGALKAIEAGNASNFNRKITGARRSVDSRDRFERGDVRSSRILFSPSTEPVKYLEVKPVTTSGARGDPSIVRASQVPGFKQLKEIVFPSSLSATQSAIKPPVTVTSTPQSTVNSRPASPVQHSRRPSPPRTAPVSSKNVLDNLKKTNEGLNQAVMRLQTQVLSLTEKCSKQDMEIQRLHKNSQMAVSLAAEQSSKFTAANEVVKTITAQLKEMVDKLPPDVIESESFKSAFDQAVAFVSSMGDHKAPSFEELTSIHTQWASEGSSQSDLVQSSGNNPINDNKSSNFDKIEAAPPPTSHNDANASGSSSTAKKEKLTQVIEQFEPGVYVTLVLLSDGTKIFNRVRFSKRKFDEHQAEEWWKENKERLLRRYSSSTALQPPSEPAANPATTDPSAEPTLSEEASANPEPMGQTADPSPVEQGIVTEPSEPTANNSPN